MKKALSILLALVMILSLATTVFAAGEGSITITSAYVGEDYAVYKIFDLVSYEGTNYSYKLSAEWAGFTSDAFEVNSDGYIDWKAENTEAAAIAFADEALAYAKKNNIEPTATQLDVTSTTVVFEDLDLGYYLVETSVGTVLAIDTTNPDVTINEKNIKPSIDKTVDGGDTTTESIGSKVDYSVAITAQKGATNYVLHDTMTEGLTFDNNVVVKAGDTTLSAGVDYTVVTPGTCGCTFEVKFEQSYLDKISAETNITVTYSATLNENAVIAGEGNKNTAQLTYGNESKTTEDTTVTYTYSFDLVKTDSDNKLLDGAKFVLYTDEGLSAAVELIAVEGGYRVAEADEDGITEFEVDGGKLTISGLANGTYYLKETAAPAGYNLLAAATEVEIQNANLSATITEGVWTEGGVHVVNNAGTELPSTGGVGTTMFYIFGSLMVVGAAVVLVTKKRMTAAE